MKAWRACSGAALLSLLPAVEKSGNQEQQREHEGQLCVGHGAQMQPEDSIHKPRRAPDEPYPRQPSHLTSVGRSGPIAFNIKTLDSMPVLLLSDLKPERLYIRDRVGKSVQVIKLFPCRASAQGANETGKA